jgi:hypothetical protein
LLACLYALLSHPLPPPSSRLLPSPILNLLTAYNQTPCIIHPFVAPVDPRSSH